jgi:predicted aldo/keto reductase-like oxidoreductase
MQSQPTTRRHFLRTSAALAGSLFIGSSSAWSAGPAKQTAVDQVTLGKTGIKLSRLGFGAGSHGGSVQRNLGQTEFTRLIRYAYDQGITYIDTAQNYQTHGMVKKAIEGIPREKLFIQTKMPGTPEKPLEVLDRYRREVGVDYFDSLLVHCTVTPNWDEQRKRLLDAFEEAKDKQIIRSHGVSCHSLPALKRAVALDWVDVHLVRVNPQGAWVDTPEPTWNAKSNAAHVGPVMEQLERMHRKQRGIIGMKLIGNGEFVDAQQREKAMRFAMHCGYLSAAVIGFKSTAEIDEAIERMNRALAEMPEKTAVA